MRSLSAVIFTGPPLTRRTGAQSAASNSSPTWFSLLQDELGPRGRTLEMADLSQAEGYPWFLRELLDSCPKRPEKGVHPWLFKTARYLHRYHSPEQICEILKARVAACGREL